MEKEVAELFDSDEEFATAGKMSKADLAAQRARDKTARKKKPSSLEIDPDFAAIDNMATAGKRQALDGRVCTWHKGLAPCLLCPTRLPSAGPSSFGWPAFLSPASSLSLSLSPPPPLPTAATSKAEPQSIICTTDSDGALSDGGDDSSDGAVDDGGDFFDDDDDVEMGNGSGNGKKAGLFEDSDEDEDGDAPMGGAKPFSDENRDWLKLAGDDADSGARMTLNCMRKTL